MRGAVVWITGLPSSGKSTLARRIQARLRDAGLAAAVLDGDQVRAALDPRPGYDPESRSRFYGALARLAALLAKQGIVAIVAATAHRRAFRERARALAPRFLEVFVDVPLEACAARDAKGLYAAAQRGAVTELPGVGAGFERPLDPDVVADGGEDPAAPEAVAELLAEGW
ncbi:MAG TPA: adenylyl-sulfate kinase [Anaeromyxobacteraceae bacterium]|nr:adenylyl-sulfate kinase [Anaeromyxobacteraceae bacterium]